MRTLVLRLLLLAVLLAAGPAACNTFHGLGRDVESLGDWMQDEAEDW